jgi:hypothetical protein
MLWISFVMSPLNWFGPDVNWYKADPGVRIGVAEGITLDLLVWMAAAWLGSRVRKPQLF